MLIDGVVATPEPDVTAGDPDRSNHIAVILVHGIGDLRAGSVTKAACQGLRTALPELRLGESEPLTASPETRGAALHRTRLQWRSSAIDLLEFHWAHLSGKIRLRRPLEAAGRILGTIREFPSMAVHPRSSTAFKWVSSGIGISFALLLSMWVVLLTGSLIELSLWPDLWIRRVDDRVTEMLPPTEIMFDPTFNALLLNRGYYWSYAAQLFAWLMFALTVALGFAFAIVAVLALAFRRLRALGILLRTSAASGALTILMLFSATILYTGALVFVANLYSGVSATALLLIAVVFGAIDAAFLLMAAWLGNLLRDVVHYLGTGRGGRPLSDQEATRRALACAINELRQDPTVTRLVIVCHSLGTVVVADLLRNRKYVGAQGRTVPIDLVTAGSPIQRLIVRLLPHRLPKPIELRRELAGGELPVARWFNAYRPLDLVGMRLVSGAACRDPERGILECPLVPRWHWPWGHSNYWSDRRFTRLVAERVVAPIL